MNRRARFGRAPRRRVRRTSVRSADLARAELPGAVERYMSRPYRVPVFIAAGDDDLAIAFGEQGFFTFAAR